MVGWCYQIAFHVRPGPITARRGFRCIAGPITGLRRAVAKYLAALHDNRSRSDGLSGFVGRMIRGKVRDAARKGLESGLAAAKKKLEAANLLAGDRASAVSTSSWLA